MNSHGDPGARAGWWPWLVKELPGGPTEAVPSVPCVVWAVLEAGVCPWPEADGQLHVPLPCREMCRLFLRRLLELVPPGPQGWGRARLAFSLGAF